MDCSQAKTVGGKFSGFLSRTVVLSMVFGLGTPLAVRAQQTDSLVAGFHPLKQQAMSITNTLVWQSGTFGHTFGSSGWPDGIAPLGRDPNQTTLSVGEISLNDLFTSRPRFDFMPSAWVSGISSDPGTGFKAHFDPFRTLDPFARESLASDSISTKPPDPAPLFPDPLTLVRYESSGSGSQAVRALHVQNRVLGAVSEGKYVQAAFGYSGEGGQGEYDGARLRRAREITVRIAYATPTWQVELFEMANRRSVGAHGGVLPIPGAPYRSIYQRLGALVVDETARRRTLRNDLMLKGSTTWMGLSTSLSGIWSMETLDYKSETMQEKGVMERFVLSWTAEKDLGAAQAGFTLATLYDAYKSGTVFADNVPSSRNQSSAVVRMTGAFNRLAYAASTGLESSSGRIWNVTNASATVKEGPFELNFSVHRSGRDVYWHERSGFGASLTPAPFKAEPINQFVQTTLSWRSDLFSVAWTGMLEINRNALVVRQKAGTETAATENLYGSTTAKVSSLVLGFRDRSAKGMWAQINPVLRSAKSDDLSFLGDSWQNSMPTEWATATVGWRARLFRGDLDLNAYARARFWGEMGGLRLHAPTGLLVLPFDSTEKLGSNWLIDFVVEAGIRQAIVFLSFENGLSGTNLIYGNLIVPDYPLPELRTRFGVYWPITN